MPVSDQKVIRKMMEELKQASERMDQPVKMREHIRIIRVLADIILEEKEEPSTSEEDVVKIIKDAPSKQEISAPIDHDGANGESIFDF